MNKKRVRAQRGWQARFWAGWLVILAVACAEFWLVHRFATDWRESTASNLPIYRPVISPAFSPF